MSRKLPGGTSVFLLLGLVFIALLGLRTISTPEIWTHLAQGANSAPLSFLESDTVVNTTHLYDKLVLMFWNIGDAPLLVILNTLGLLISFILLLRVSSKWGGPISQGFALLISGHLMFQTLDTGPQVVMMLMIAAFLYTFTFVSKPALLFIILIPLQLLWTNMHGSFLFGPILAALAAGQAAQQQKGGKKIRVQTTTSKTYGLLAGALAIATLVNPYVFDLHAQVFAGIKSPAPVYWSSLFVEYFQIPALKPLILFVMLLGAGGLITLKRKLPLMLTTIAIFGAFMVWTSPRTVMLFVALSFPFMVLSLTSISEYLAGSFTNLLGNQAKLLPKGTGSVLVILLALSIWSVAGNCAYTKSGMASKFGVGIEENLYPDGAEALLTDPLFPERAINLPADGGYLAFKYDREIFLDYRSGVYDSELLEQLNDMLRGDSEAYDALYDVYRPQAIIINTLTPNAAQGIVTLLRRGIWKLAYFDGTTAILLQNKPELQPLLENKEVQMAGLIQLESARKKYASTVGSCRAGNPPELIGSGKVFLAFNRPTLSKAIFSLLLQGNEKIPGAWIGLGNSQLMLKEFDDAVQSLKTATQQAPNNFQAWSSYAVACRYAGMSDESEKAVSKAQAILNRMNEQSKKDKQEEEEELEIELDTSSVTGTSLDGIEIPED